MEETRAGRADWAVAGSSGLIGTALVERLRARGDRVLRLVRREPAGPDEARWDPDAGRIDAAALEGLRGAVNLAGESLFALRWTAAKKRRIVESRVRSTGLLASTLAGLARPPAVLVNASAVGWYGDRGDEVLDESSAPGDDFLARTCVAWEEALAPAAAAGIRAVPLRTGVVLSWDGGALATMRRPFSLGLGGRIGSGRQHMSWIALDDVVSAYVHALDRPGVRGPVNAVAPEPATNAGFTRAVGRALGRPTPFPLPAPAVRLLLGEMGEALLLVSQRVHPGALEASGFRFGFPTLGHALALC